MKPDCYQCKYRGTVPGSVHSKCNVVRERLYPELSDSEKYITELGLAAGAMSLVDNKTKEPLLKFNQHGVASGWAVWPVNFDPVWLEECRFFEQKS